MALIYASAVNRRMNALHKKNSVDIPPQHHQHPCEIVHCKQRSNEERQLLGGSGQQPTTRDASLDNIERKRSAPQPANRVNGIGNGQHAAIGSTSSNSNPVHQQKKSFEHPRASRKMTVASGQFFRPADPAASLACKPRRKISTPVMAQSVTGTLTMGGGGGMGRKKGIGIKANTPDSPPPFCGSFEEDKHQGPKSSSSNGGGGILASFGRVIRRRSVSADDSVFRRRGGTSSSLDSSQGEESPGGRKSSAFQKMKERLNKWKLSG